MSYGRIGGIPLLIVPLMGLQEPAEPPVLRIGEPVTGIVGEQAPPVHTATLDERYTVAPTVGISYVLEVGESGPYHAELRSYAFDAYLVLRGPDGQLLAEDDDGWLSTHSRVTAQLEAGAKYRLTACALHGKRGEFELSFRFGRPQPLTPSQERQAEGEDMEQEILWAEERHGEDSLELADALNLNGLRLWRAGMHEEAEAAFQRSLSIREAALGPNSLEVAQSLDNLSNVYINQGRLPEVESLKRRALGIREATLGRDHPDVALSLNNFGMFFLAQERYAEAQALLERALRIREAALRGDDSRLATSLNNLGLLHKALGRYEVAIPLFERATAIYEQAGGPLVATSLGNLAGVYATLGQYGKARTHCERALAVQGRMLRPGHPRIAGTLNSLALISVEQLRFAEAERQYQRALRIIEESLGATHHSVAVILNNLASLYHVQGRYAEAEPLFKRSLVIREARLDPSHTDIANGLNNLALLYFDEGRYGEAEPLFRRALASFEGRLGPTHPSLTATLNNLGATCQFQARMREAEAFYKRALEVGIEGFGPEHVEVASCLNSLATLYLKQGRSQESRRVGERALRIRESVLGPEHYEVALSLSNLAAVLSEQGLLVEAEALHRRSLTIRKKALGSRHPSVGESLNNLAAICAEEGRWAEAETLYEQAISILESSLGGAHPRVARCLRNAARLWESQGEYAQALPQHERALRSTLDYLERELPVISETERFRTLAMMDGPGAGFSSAARCNQALGREQLDLALRWKGMATRLQAAGMEISRRRAEAEIRRRIGALQGIQKELGTLVFLPESEHGEDHAERVAALREERSRIERELNRELGLEALLTAPSSAEIQVALPEDSVLLDFYVGDEVFVWVLHPGTREPRMVPLGDSAELRTAQRAFLDSTLQRESRSAVAAETGAARLSELLTQPLLAEIGAAATVFVSPDSFLCELPFGILADDGGYLLEKHRFAYLSDATRLLECDGIAANREGRTLAVGDVDYEERGDAWEGFVAAAQTRSRVGDSWPPLRGTREELQRLRELHDGELGWKAEFTRLERAEATEEAVQSLLPGRRYAHFATHGYFEPDHLPSLMRDAEEKSASAAMQEQLEAVGLLPGYLSGLVLSGANAEPAPDRSDGYFSAQELMYLDLSACDLAVLSACQTALGSERAGNGLISLRRAFEVAGAKTVVSSLWQVDDEATVDLMTRFYENYWLRGLGKAESLHRAKLQLLKKNRAKYGGDARPYSWGAFVLSGDWE